MKRFLLVFVGFMFCVGCADTKDAGGLESEASGSSIIGGEDVQSYEIYAKSTVQLAVKFAYSDGSSETGICSAIIVDQSTLLTAAHCFDSKKTATDRKVYISFSNKAALQRTPFGKYASSFFVDPSYTSDSYGSIDAAIVKFAGGIPSGFAPALLQFDSSIIDSLTSVVAVGFGINNFATGDFPDLQKIKLELSPHPDVLFMNESSTKGVCHGDSGGPVFSDDGEVVGMIVQSFGGACDAGGVAIRLDKLSTAIRDRLQ